MMLSCSATVSSLATLIPSPAAGAGPDEQRRVGPHFLPSWSDIYVGLRLLRWNSQKLPLPEIERRRPVAQMGAGIFLMRPDTTLATHVCARMQPSSHPPPAPCA
jgi:hypothetical protein